MKYFKNLFCSTKSLSMENHGHIRYTLGDDERIDLVKLVTKDKVYKAFMSMTSYKAPGPDGF